MSKQIKNETFIKEGMGRNIAGLFLFMPLSPLVKDAGALVLESSCPCIIPTKSECSHHERHGCVSTAKN